VEYEVLDKEIDYVDIDEVLEKAEQ